MVGVKEKGVNMTKDFGTYHLRIELENSQGWIEEWNTSWRYTHGSGSVTKLDASKIEPPWENEKDLFSTMKYMYLEGNFSCDCNKSIFLAAAYQQGEPEEIVCGDTMPVKRLTAIRPDMTEVVIYKLPNRKINQD